MAQPILLPHEGEPVGSGLRAPETPSKAALPRQPGQPCPDSPYWERGAGGESDLHCFLDPRHVGAVVCCLRSVSLCRMQLPEDCFRPSVRWGLRAEWPSWLRGHGWGLGTELLRAPNPASPRRRTRVECDSGAGNPQQSSRAQGSRGSPAQLRPMESGGPVSKTDSGAFLSGGALGLWFAARGEFPFAGCSSKKLVLGRRCEGTSALSGRAGSGGMAGPRAQKAFVRPVLLAHEG